MKILKYEEVTYSKDVKLWFSETDYITVEDVRGNLIEVLEEQKVPKDVCSCPKLVKIIHFDSDNKYCMVCNKFIETKEQFTKTDFNEPTA